MTDPMNETLICYPPPKLRRWMRRIAAETRAGDVEFSKGAQGAVIGAINRALRVSAAEKTADLDVKRRLLLAWIFGDDSLPLDTDGVSSSALTFGQLYALRRWTGQRQVGDRWLSRPALPAEALWIYNRALWVKNLTEFALERRNRILPLGEVNEIYDLFYPDPDAADPYLALEYQGMAAFSLRFLGAEVWEIADGDVEVVVPRTCPEPAAARIRSFFSDLGIRLAFAARRRGAGGGSWDDARDAWIADVDSGQGPEPFDSGWGGTPPEAGETVVAAGAEEDVQPAPPRRRPVVAGEEA